VRAAFLAIGDEIVGGLTTDTNSGFLATELKPLGVQPVAGFSVADDEEDIIRALRRALDEAELVVCTGGLGPTADDLTTACVAKLAGRELVLDEPSLHAIEERFRARAMEMSPNNRKQALFPEGSTIFPNPNGTAAGFVCPVQVNGATRHVACFPGVPRETRELVPASLVRAAFPRMQVRVTVSGGPGEDLEPRLDEMEARIRERLGNAIYAVGDEGMEETVGRLLRERGLTLAVAESCTGGRIGDRVTDVPGSSEYFLLGVATYANEAKVRVLGVSESTIAEHGAVSTQTAAEMAAGVRKLAGADLGIATTGIAGPGGGTPEKPVGTLCIGLAWEGGQWSRRYDVGNRGREWLKGMAAQIALDRLRQWLLGVAD
jgi:nicotinamide-nucleotide amidase